MTIQSGNGSRRPFRSAEPGASVDAAQTPNGQSPAREADDHVAALDLGTNNCRLLIARRAHGSARILECYSNIVRLGEGLAKTGMLSEAGMWRTIRTLKRCAEKMRHYQVCDKRLIATQACRHAGNGRYFIERVERETGLRLEIISRHAEMQLAVLGCCELIDPQSGGCLVVDIGGGSTEIGWIDGDRLRAPQDDAPPPAIRAWMSLNVGVVNLSEGFGGAEIGPQDYAKLLIHIDGLLADFPEDKTLKRAAARDDLQLLGTSGTVTTLAGIRLGLKYYDRRKVDGLWIGREDLPGLFAAAKSMSHEAHVDHPCIGPGRADLVVPGCAILEAMLRRWPCAGLRVADRGLRDGLLVELMAGGAAAGRSGSGLSAQTALR